MNTRFIVLMLTVLLTAASGCSRIREMTRRDYAMLRDPFAGRLVDDEESVADTDEPPLPGMERKESGVVTIGDISDREIGGRTTADYSAVTEDSPKTASANPAAVFPGLRVRATEDSVSSEFGQAAFADQADRIRKEAAGTAALLRKQARENVLTETAEDIQEDFAEYAAERQKQWKQDIDTTQKEADPLIQQVSRTVAPTQTPPKVKKFSDLADIENAAAHAAESATPLITGGSRKTTTENPNAAKETRPPVFSDLANPDFGEPSSEPPRPKLPERPVFDAPDTAGSPADLPPNPFAAFEKNESDSSSDSEKTEAAGKKLDTGFNFDSGWRPSGVVQP